MGMIASQSVPNPGSAFLSTSEIQETPLSTSISSQSNPTPPPMLKPIVLDYQIHKNQAPLHSTVYLGSGSGTNSKCEYGIHSYEIMSPIVLTILTRPSVRFF